ncbi:MAG: DUF3299 domain-containing protein [Planctomycetota bacterium]
MNDQQGLSIFGKIMLVIMASILVVNGCNSSTDETPVSSNTPSDDDPAVATVSVTKSGSSDRDNSGDDQPPEDLKVRQRTMIRRGGVLDLTFDDLEFDIEVDEDFKDEMLTEKIRSFDGKSVILRGFILGASVFQQKGFTEFVLIRDNQKCCFGPGAKIYHNVMVEMNEGKSADFSFTPVEARGKLTIKPWVNPGDGKTYSVFHLAAEKVK